MEVLLAKAKAALNEVDVARPPRAGMETLSFGGLGFRV